MLCNISDVTALCILEQFQNPKSLMTADRVLKQLGQSKAKETYAVSCLGNFSTSLWCML